MRKSSLMRGSVTRAPTPDARSRRLKRGPSGNDLPAD